MLPATKNACEETSNSAAERRVDDLTVRPEHHGDQSTLLIEHRPTGIAQTSRAAELQRFPAMTSFDGHIAQRLPLVAPQTSVAAVAARHQPVAALREILSNGNGVHVGP